jgi:hypothetical protein
VPSEEAIIADSSPLIGLAKMGQLDLLPLLAGRIIVPAAVWSEVVNPAISAPGAREVAACKWFEIVAPDPAAVAPLLILLGAHPARNAGVSPDAMSSLSRALTSDGAGISLKRTKFVRYA